MTACNMCVIWATMSKMSAAQMLSEAEDAIAPCQPRTTSLILAQISKSRLLSGLNI